VAKLQHRIPVIGITGGIGCGKSTVARMFHDYGAYLIDADEVGRIVLEADSSVQKQILNHFGDGILGEDGTINRKRLGDIVFIKKENLETLNGIIHPVMTERITKEINKVQRSGKVPLIAVDAAVIFEAKVEKHFDAIITVTAGRELQLQRMTERSGMSPEQVKKRIDSQIPLEEKEARSHYVLKNEGAMNELQREVKNLFIKIVKQFAIEPENK